MQACIDHVNFQVTDVEKTAELMQQLGYAVIRRTNHHGGAIELESPAQPGLVLELTSLREGETPGFNHVCFRLESEQNFQSLQDHNFPLTGPSHVSAGSGRRIANFKDPDQLKWQLTY